MTGSKAIECTISPGMFSDELLVKFQIGSKEFAFFVPREAVTESASGQARLRVDVLEQGDAPVVVVPNEARTAIGVHQADLVEA